MSTKVNVNVSELVIITEVKFIKKFLHAVCEHCQVSDDPYFKCFILRSVVLTKSQKVRGTVSGILQVQRGRRDNTI